MLMSNLACDILHTISVQMAHRFEPDALEEELHDRVRNSEFSHNVRYTTIEADEDDKSAYRITLKDPESIPDILAILSRIDADVSAAKEQQRLLGMLRK